MDIIYRTLVLSINTEYSLKVIKAASIGKIIFKRLSEEYRLIKGYRNVSAISPFRRLSNF